MLIAECCVADVADGSNPGPRDVEARTPDRRAIFERGPLNRAALTSRFGWAPALPRRRLDLVAEQGAIEERTLADVSRSGRGRGCSYRAYFRSEAGLAGWTATTRRWLPPRCAFLQDTPVPMPWASSARERSAGLEARSSAQLATAGEDVAGRVGTGYGTERRRCRHFHPATRSGHAPGRCSCAQGTVWFSTSLPSSRRSVMPSPTRCRNCRGLHPKPGRSYLWWARLHESIPMNADPITALTTPTTADGRSAS